jgi:tyrosyl-tRNA synthetase
MNNVIDVLRERGFIDAETSPDLRQMTEKPIKVYCGFDPTADSLHLGNFVGIMGLAWFQRMGHTPVALVGGATGMIGDPSGKSAERQFLTADDIATNLQGIRKDLEAVLHQGPTPPVFVNNLDWYKNFSIIDFLRDVGKFFRVGPMLAKDSVKKRLESEDGMSFTEFSYQVLQGYDFLHLYQEKQVVLQIGGSDQWGNITAGVEVVRKVLGKPVFGLTFPLLLKSDGQKFGKSEKGAVWLSPDKLSPYEFYQFLFRTSDADVVRCLKMLTFLPMDEIRKLEAQMNAADYIPNTLQKRLAEEVTRVVHGEIALQTALKVTLAAAPGLDTVLNADDLERISADMPSSQFAKAEVVGLSLIDLLVKAELLKSKSEARRMLENGGVYLNNEKMTDNTRLISPNDLLDGRLLLLAVGKKNKKIIRIS